MESLVCMEHSQRFLVGIRWSVVLLRSSQTDEFLYIQSYSCASLYNLPIPPTMDSCSRSVQFPDTEAVVPGSTEKMDLSDLDPTCKVQAWSRSPLNPCIVSPICLIRALGNVARLLWHLMPACLQPKFQKEPGKQEKVHPSAYLDGMRGLAAFAVFLCHLSYGTFDTAHVYGAGELGKNVFFWQLPIVRLFYAGPPQVAIFFVISGYALSYKPIKLMRAQQHEALLTTMTSAMFRRALRLFLPCLMSTFLVSCMAQLGLYKMTEDFAQSMRVHHEDHAWTAPDAVTQFVDWAYKMFEFVNVFDWSIYAGSIDLDQHLWTIPAEYRCSLALFVSQLLVARMSPRMRLSIFTFLFWWGTRWNRWDLCPFWAGAIIAELDLMKLSAESKDEVRPINLDGSPIIQSNRRGSFWPKSAYFVIFVTGLFLASYPDVAGHETPGYIYLTKMIPEGFTEMHRFWPTIGAVMIVWSTSNLASLRSIFSSAPIQYLGKISFPLYVMHGPIIHTFGYMVMDYMLDITGYDEDDLRRFQLGFLISAFSVIIATIWSADLFLRTVDIPCVRFARWLEGKFFNS